MLQAASEWEQTHDSAAVRQALLQGIEVYLGRSATARLADAGPENGSRLLAEIEPVLELFLGKAAATQLVSHLLDRAFVRA